MALAQNPIRALLESKQADLDTARKRLSDLTEEERHLYQLQVALARAHPQDRPAAKALYDSAGGNTRLYQVRGAIPSLRSLVTTLEAEVAKLAVDAQDLDEKAEQAILNGTDPQAAYSAELAKMQTKATLITIGKYALVIGAALLLLYYGRKLFTKITGR